MNIQLKKQNLKIIISQLFEQFHSVRDKLFEIVEIPHLSCINDNSQFNIYYDFYHIEKSLKYMKKNLNPQTFKQISSDAKSLITKLKEYLKAVNMIQESIVILDDDDDQEANFFDYKSAEMTRSKVSID